MSPRGREIAAKFAQRFISWETAKQNGRWVSTPARVFAAAMADRTIYRFHINALEDFKLLLGEMHMQDNLVEWVQQPAFAPYAFGFKLKPTWVPHEYQVPYIDYLAADEPIAKLLEFQTGRGKTISALFAIARRNHRVVGVLKPKYLEKWVEDFRKTFDNMGKPGGEEDKIVVIQGGKELKALLELAKDDQLDAAVILISNATYRNWISEYEEYGEASLDLGYSCYPENLYQHLKAGVRLVDESHEDFHFCFKLDMYTHVPSSIDLTATLIHKQSFMQRMYDVKFPPKTRMAKLALDRYANVVNYLYNFKKPEFIRTEEWGQSTYSHTALETSVMNHKGTLENYFGLIRDTLNHFYMQERKPGEKAIVYCASVKMCTLLTKYLSDHFHGLTVRRFIGTKTDGVKDDYKNVIESDICVSTIGRAGTAFDIQGLTFVLMTTALDSVQGNIQALGRLRKREDGKTLFMFLTAENIPKHCKYAEAKRELFKDRAATFRTIPSGWNV